jgi:hypothetical protein
MGLKHSNSSSSRRTLLQRRILCGFRDGAICIRSSTVEGVTSAVRADHPQQDASDHVGRQLRWVSHQLTWCIENRLCR